MFDLHTYKRCSKSCQFTASIRKHSALSFDSQQIASLVVLCLLLLLQQSSIKQSRSVQMVRPCTCAWYCKPCHFAAITSNSDVHKCSVKEVSEAHPNKQCKTPGETACSRCEKHVCSCCLLTPLMSPEDRERMID